MNKFPTNSSRRRFLSTVAMTTTASAGILLRPRVLPAADVTDPRVATIVAGTIGIDTHNHVDVPLTAAEMPGPVGAFQPIDQARRFDRCDERSVVGGIHRVVDDVFVLMHFGAAHHGVLRG